MPKNPRHTEPEIVRAARPPGIFNPRSLVNRLRTQTQPRRDTFTGSPFPLHQDVSDDFEDFVRPIDMFSPQNNRLRDATRKALGILGVRRNLQRPDLRLRDSDGNWIGRSVPPVP